MKQEISSEQVGCPAFDISTYEIDKKERIEAMLKLGSHVGMSGR